jgi:hypothetical protein
LWWKWSGGSDWQNIFALQQRLQSRLQEARVSVMRGRFESSGTDAAPTAVRYLQVSVVYPRRIDSFAAAGDAVAAAVLEDADAAQVDELRITVSYGFDILIASRYWAESFVHTPEQWLQRLRQSTPPAPTQARGRSVETLLGNSLPAR